MPRKSNIKVETETFESLRVAKPDGVSWDAFLRAEILESADVTNEDLLTAIEAIPDRTATELRDMR